MNKFTIKDIAKLLRLSTSTVSRALSDHPDISVETRKRVKDVAEELHYNKNLYASFFRSNRSGLIALILPEINMFYTPKMIKSINNLITPSYYSLIISLTNDEVKKEEEIIDKCIKWSVDGVLLSLSKTTQNLDYVLKLKEHNIPCVMLDKTIDNSQFTSVTINNILSAKNATQYLIEKGHQQVLGIFGSLQYTISKERLAGFQQALSDNDLPYAEQSVLTVENSQDLESLLPDRLKKNQISALFVMSDELLAKTVYVVQKMKLTIPDDISIIAISDGVYPYLVYPNITHLKDSGNKLGKYAANTLLNNIQNSNLNEAKHHFIETKLVEADSVKKLTINKNKKTLQTQ